MTGMRRGGLLAALGLLAVLAAPASAAVPEPVAADAATDPAGGAWLTTTLGTDPRDPCVSWASLAECSRPGGLAAQGDTVLALRMTRLSSEFGTVDFAITQRSTNGAVSFGAPEGFGGGLDSPYPYWEPAVAQRGSAVNVVLYRPDRSKGLVTLRSPDLGASWGAKHALGTVGMVITNVGIASGGGNRVAIVQAGYDEVIDGSPSNHLQVRVSKDNGATWPTVHRFAWRGRYCWFEGTDPVVAITDNGTIVVAYWKSCKQLLVTRSTNGGSSWSAPTTLSVGPHSMGMALAAHGSDLVLAYTANGVTKTRHSGNNGASWGSAVSAGSGAASLRLAYGGGLWHLLAGGTDRLRYRASASGTSWTSGDTVAELLGARTYAVGLAYAGGPLLEYAIKTGDKQFTTSIARRP